MPTQKQYGKEAPSIHKDENGNIIVAHTFSEEMLPKEQKEAIKRDLKFFKEYTQFAKSTHNQALADVSKTAITEHRSTLNAVTNEDKNSCCLPAYRW